ncbi:MAG: hypothetical protein LUC50_03140, partial [Ruminococcus sp.]|nr:hypothetical protein [Ruminococcus sp.]
ALHKIRFLILSNFLGSVHIGMLVAFKYTNFFIENLNQLLHVFSVSIPKMQLTMPLGISFYTFQIVSYLADVYTKNIALLDRF